MIGSVLTTIMAADPDEGANGEVEYEIVNGDTDTFTVDRYSGDLRVASALVPSQLIYNLIVSATDLGPERRKSTTELTVILQGLDGPVFTQNKYITILKEGEPIGTNVISIEAASPRGSEAPVEYYIVSVHCEEKTVGRLFTIGRQTGIIQTAAILDREQGACLYLVDVYAIEKSSAFPRTQRAEVEITLQDINDNPPVFPTDTLDLTVEENIGDGSKIMQLTAMDADEGANALVTYALISGADDSFRIDPESGDLIATKRLDREHRSKYSLLVRADDGLQSSDMRINITISDVNDHTPKFSRPVYSFDILEDTTPGSLVAAILATDDDSGVNGEITYVVDEDDGDGVFFLNPVTGVFNLTRALDYETQQYYILTVRAEDGGGQFSTIRAYFNILDVNDNPPVFSMSAYSTSLVENLPLGSTVLVFNVSDADDGVNAQLSYSIASGDSLGQFAVDKHGVLKTLKALDRESQSFYNLVIQVHDSPQPPASRFTSTAQVSIILLDVNDNPPRFPQKHYQMSVLESAPISSTVGRVFAKDLDEGINAEMKYTIVDGDGADAFDINTDPNFQVGIITVKKPLSFESKKSYTLKVEGANPHLEMRFLNLGPFQDTTTVHISVEDVDEPPVFEPGFYFVEVPEDVTIGTTIQIISAKDPDVSNNSIRYSIDRSSDPGRFFYVDITTGALMTARPLDREAFSWHNITILAMEMNNPSQVGSVVVTIKVLDVNDNAPEFPRFYEAFICENAKAGQLIQTVSAVDQDDPHNGQHFYYSLAPEAANNPNFTVRDNQDNTARILTRRSGFRQQEQSVFYLPILIADSGEPVLSSTGTLTIQVCSCNDDGHVMSCSPEAYMLPVSLSRGALIAILACVFVLLVLVLLILSMRRHRKQPYIIDDDENIHENIVRYDDEGGGEEDTEAFDIAAMWNPREAQAQAQAGAPKARQDMLPEIESLSRYVPQTCAVSSTVHSYVLAKLYEADMDLWAPPFDSLQTYMFEGDGSVAGSLSSLQSATSDSEQSFDFLTDWGPRFRKLAELYGASEGPAPVW